MAKPIAGSKTVLHVLGKEQPVRFAASELARYWKQITGAAPKIEPAAAYDPKQPGLWIGLAERFGAAVPKNYRDSKDEFDDGIFVQAQNGHAVVSGVNPRSVLFAAYRFLEELGCRWFRPGPGGESVPKAAQPLAKRIRVAERPTARHRCICIEGSCAFEHVRDMIDYAPKRGFNAYFFQFRDSYVFWNLWYQHEQYWDKPGAPLTEKEAMAICDRAKREALKRGLLIHTVGHGWTTSPFGIAPRGWTAKSKIPGKAVQYFAEMQGRRGMAPGRAGGSVDHLPLITNLCYSNPKARAIMVEDVARYAKARPEEKVIHVWLADAANSNCECPKCRDTRPSDFYVLLLNELDERLTAQGSDAKVIFLAYIDLLYAPEKNKIANPDRFILMFAPITRSYTTAFMEKTAKKAPEPAPFVYNKLTFPTSPQTNLAMFNGWKRAFSGERVDFDYHLWNKVFTDPAHMQMAEVLFKDIRDLPKLGMSGLISCQNQRVAFPTGFCMHVMGKTLWNQGISYNRMADEYFTALFGPDGKKARKYLEELSCLLDPAYLRGEKPGDEQRVEARNSWAKIAPAIAKFQPAMDKGMRSPLKPRALAWTLLNDHAVLMRLLADYYIGVADKSDWALKSYSRIMEELKARRQRLTPVFDMHNWPRMLGRAIWQRR